MRLPFVHTIEPDEGKWPRRGLFICRDGKGRLCELTLAWWVRGRTPRRVFVHSRFEGGMALPAYWARASLLLDPDSGSKLWEFAKGVCAAPEVR